MRIRKSRFGVAIRMIFLSANALGATALAQEPRLTLRPLSEISLESLATGSEQAARVCGDRLVVPLGARGVAVFDISDPSMPAPLAAIDATILEDQGGASALMHSGRLFVSLPIRQTIAVIDLDGAVPVKLGEFGSVSQVTSLAMTDIGLLAYGRNASGNLGGIFAFDVSNDIPGPSGDYLVDLTDPGFFARKDGVAYIARTPNGPDDPAQLEIVDMSTPASPHVLGTWSSDMPGNISGIDVADDSIALAAYWGGVWILDASNPESMQATATYDWEAPFAYAVDVVYTPPFVLALEGGPAAEMKQLGTLLLNEDNHLEWQDAIPVPGIPLAISREGNLILVQSQTDQDGDGWTDHTLIQLYESDVVLFQDGFDIAS